MTEKNKKYHLNLIIKTFVFVVLIGAGLLSLSRGVSAQQDCKPISKLPYTSSSESVFAFPNGTRYSNIPTNWCSTMCPPKDTLRNSNGQCSSSATSIFIQKFNTQLGLISGISPNYLEFIDVSRNWCERCEPVTTNSSSSSSSPSSTPTTTTISCVQEIELFKPNSSKDYNLAGATSAPWCNQCPPHNELRDDETNKCIAPNTFVTKVNALITNPANKIVLTDMDPDWCTACSANPDTAVQQGGGSGGNSGGNPVVVGDDEFDRLKNPLGEGNGVGSLTDFVARILKIIIMIGVPILVLAFIWVGFTYVKAQGNPSKIKENHMALVYTLIGGALLLGASKLAAALKDTVEEIAKGN